ncbi:MAG: hypothetical protein AB7F37_11160 [Variibacter sp.]
METDTAGRVRVSPSRAAGSLQSNGRGLSAVTPLAPAEAVAPPPPATDTHNESTQQGATRYMLSDAARQVLMDMMELRSTRLARRASDSNMQRVRAYEQKPEAPHRPDDDEAHTDVST